MTNLGRPIPPVQKVERKLLSPADIERLKREAIARCTGTTRQDYWLAAAYWTLDEATAISLGWEPRPALHGDLVRYHGDSAEARQYEERRTLLFRATYAGALGYPVQAPALAAWMDRHQIARPAALVAVNADDAAIVPSVAQPATSAPDRVGGAAKPKPRKKGRRVLMNDHVMAVIARHVAAAPRDATDIAIANDAHAELQKESGEGERIPRVTTVQKRVNLMRQRAQASGGPVAADPT